MKTKTIYFIGIEMWIPDVSSTWIRLDPPKALRNELTKNGYIETYFGEENYMILLFNLLWQGGSKQTDNFSETRVTFCFKRNKTRTGIPMYRQQKSDLLCWCHLKWAHIPSGALITGFIFRKGKICWIIR